jgi:hypothetical protein
VTTSTIDRPADIPATANRTIPVSIREFFFQPVPVQAPATAPARTIPVSIREFFHAPEAEPALAIPAASGDDVARTLLGAHADRQAATYTRGFVTVR